MYRIVLFVALKHMQFMGVLYADAHRRAFLLYVRTAIEYEMRTHTSTKSRVCTLYVWIQMTISTVSWSVTSQLPFGSCWSRALFICRSMHSIRSVSEAYVIILRMRQKAKMNWFDVSSQ